VHKQRLREQEEQVRDQSGLAFGFGLGSILGVLFVFMQEAGSMNGSDGSCSREASPPAQSRTQRIHLLRAQHQRRHVERQGHYPLDEREECYEQVIRQVRQMNASTRWAGAARTLGLWDAALSSPSRLQRFKYFDDGTFYVETPCTAFYS